MPEHDDELHKVRRRSRGDQALRPDPSGDARGGGAAAFEVRQHIHERQTTRRVRPGRLSELCRNHRHLRLAITW